ncbi:Ricin B-like lectin R40C1 [Rhynchospora pubera]|uniref:Ricin B-like lectin R40C1 n=1 Tax=Rhynchospora pubera TaxID=906938 RepID=A0AAV8HKU2_9POAL|nr:Ricin B-like lectin R40C1 [Rhynchospora pubera]
MSNKATTFFIINQADVNYCLAARASKVVFALVDPRDPYQQWIKKETPTKDQEGQPAFVLVNKATNETINHSKKIGPLGLVQNYQADDNSVLWTESKDGDKDFKYIRWVGRLDYNIVANNHEIHDGRIVDLAYGTHISQRWKFVADNSKDEQVTAPKTVAISCRRKEGFNLTVRNGTVVLAPADPNDTNQIWIKDVSYANRVKDQDGKQAFALINKATGKAIKHGFGPGYLVQLAEFNRNYLDSSLLWTESEKALGFREIRMQANTSAAFNVFYVNEADSNKALLTLRLRNDSSDQEWKFQEIIDTTPEKPSNQWDPSKADIFFDGGK